MFKTIVKQKKNTKFKKRSAFFSSYVNDDVSFQK